MLDVVEQTGAPRVVEPGQCGTGGVAIVTENGLKVLNYLWVVIDDHYFFWHLLGRML